MTRKDTADKTRTFSDLFTTPTKPSRGVLRYKKEETLSEQCNMCARRNPKTNPSLIGDFEKCGAKVPTWRGEVPKGLDEEQREKARRLKRKLWDEGHRKAAIVDAIEEAMAREENQAPTKVTVNTCSGQWFAEHWRELNWRPHLQLLWQPLRLNDGEVDLVFLDQRRTAVVLIEVQADRDDEEVIETLAGYVRQVKESLKQVAATLGVALESSGIERVPVPVEIRVEPFILTERSSAAFDAFANRSGIKVLRFSPPYVGRASANDGRCSEG